MRHGAHIAVRKRATRVVALLVCLLAGAAALRAQVPQYAYAPALVGTISGIPFNSTNNKVQWLYYPTDFTPTLPAGRVNVIYLRSANDFAASKHQNLHVRMAHTALTAFTPATAAFVTSGMDTVFYTEEYTVPMVARGEWIPFPVRKPFVFDGTRNIIVEVSVSGTASPLATLQSVGLNTRRRHGPVTATSGTAGTGPAVLGFDFARPNDAGAVVVRDAVQQCPYTVRARLVNYGTNRLTQAQIHWEVNGVAQSPVPWNGVVDTFGSAAGNSVVVTLGSIPLSAGVASSVKVWTSLPNGVADAVRYNDTSVASIVAPPGLIPEQVTDTFPGSHCGPGPVVLRANGTGLVLRWYDTLTGGSVLGMGNTFTTPTVAATSTFYVAAGNASGCESARLPVTAYIHLPPQVSIQPSGQVPLCAGDSVALYASSGIGYSYRWYRNQVALPGASFSVFKAGESGEYTVFAEDEQIGCGGLSRPVTVVRYPLPDPVVSFDGTSLSTGTFVTYQWSRNGRLIPGANTRTYIPPEHGHYTVTVRDANGCVNTSAAYPVYPVGIRGWAATAQDDLPQVYPNPANAWVYLHAPAGSTASFCCMDGKTILRLSLTDPAHPADISMLPEGLYLLRITDNTGDVLGILKFIKTQSY